MSSVAWVDLPRLEGVDSSAQPKRPLSPFAVPECGACMGERCHTEAEWKAFHPLAGHGFTKEQGWTHPEAKALHLKEAFEAKNVSTPEAN